MKKKKKKIPPTEVVAQRMFHMGSRLRAAEHTQFWDFLIQKNLKKATNKSCQTILAFLTLSKPSNKSAKLGPLPPPSPPTPPSH